MTMYKQELRQGRASFVIWTAAIALLLVFCILLFPEMKGEMEAMGSLFAAMGSFAAAFGMDRLNIGTLTGFYAIECGNILGLGGAFFASLVGISALAKEEGGGTAEFLLTHPIARARVVTEKLLAVCTQITALNLILLGSALLSIALIREAVPVKALLLMHGAYYLLQLELAGICFGISAFLRRGGVGIGLGLAAFLYVLNLLANLSERVRFLKAVTPFGYCEGADLLAEGRLDIALAAPGVAFACLCVAAAYVWYAKKDIT